MPTETNTPTCVSCEKEPGRRRCVSCRKPICDGCAMYRGRDVAPDADMIKCAMCDYEDYCNTIGGM